MIKKDSMDAGWDLVSTHAAIVGNHAVTKIHTGDFGDIPPGHVGLICPRSGLAAKHGVFVVNGPGVIDAGFCGEICVLLSKVGEEPYPVRKGDRIAQLVVVPLSAYTPGAQSDRGEKGFGSSGLTSKPRNTPCDNCAVTDADCMRKIRRGGVACCSRCTYTDTHNAL